MRQFLKVALLVCLLPLITHAEIVTGTKTITTAGTQLPIATSKTLVTSIVIQAHPANTGYIYVGDSTVDANTGIRLSAGDKFSISVDPRNQGASLIDLNKLYLDTSVNGEGARLLYLTTR